jgi:hypothetical protein
MQNKKSKLYLMLLTPSAMSAVFYTFLAGMIVLLHQFQFIEQYLQIPGNVNFMRMFLDWLDRTATSLLGDTVIETAVVGLFWAIVGLCVYVFLRGLVQFISDIAAGADERTYVWPRGTNRNRALMEALERVMLRTFAFLGLAVVVLGPLARATNGPVLLGLAGGNAVLKYVVWFIVLWLLMHLSVVLMRLIMLKPRIFG